MKNIFVNTEKKYKINKRNVHKVIFFTANEFDYHISSLEINFVSSKLIKEINTKYLAHNYETDVISFNYSNESNNLDGEIFICLDVAKENAKKYRVNFENEVRRIIIHGILHLIGYNDHTTKSKIKMRKAENYLLDKIKRTDKIIVNS